MRERFRRLCEAAALATGTSVEVSFTGRAPRRCATTRVLADRFRANMAAYGIVDQGDDLNAGSTDMANVSRVCPTIHPDLAIAPEGTPGHSILFRDAAATPRADEVDPARRHPDRPDRLRPVTPIPTWWPPPGRNSARASRAPRDREQHASSPNRESGARARQSKAEGSTGASAPTMRERAAEPTTREWPALAPAEVSATIPWRAPLDDGSNRRRSQPDGWTIRG